MGSTGSSSYIAIDPNTGMQYKVELPNGQLGDGLNDPLAAIMNETIFTETTGGTMFTTENGQVIYTTQTASSVGSGQHQLQQIPPPQASSAGGKKGKKRQNKENAIMADSVDDLPCAPDDEDLNISYNCEVCNRSIKGKVMMQAHKFQEHHENPDFEASNFPDDKFACRVCLKLFTRNSDVKAHILRVHCGDRRYPCTMCGKRFKESTHLRKHLYTHTGERPHFCKLCGKGFQTSSDLKRHKRTRVHQEKVEQVAAQGGDIDDDEAIITGTGMVVTATAGNTAGVLEHDEGQHTPEFKVWPEGHHDEESSRNSGASSQQPQGGHPETADLLSNIQQQPSTTTTSGMETQYSSTIDMKDLGGPASVVVASTTWSGGQLASGSSSSSVNTTAPTVIRSSPADPLGTVITTSATGSAGTTVDMNLLKWQNTQQPSTAMPPPQPGGPGSAASKRGVSVDSPGQDEERLTVVEGDDSSQDSASVASASNVATGSAA